MYLAASTCSAGFFAVIRLQLITFPRLTNGPQRRKTWKNAKHELIQSTDSSAVEMLHATHGNVISS
jgi:hypothetical protein